MKGFSKRFNSLRLEGETQKEFADRLGLTQASISRYLSGHSPDRESLGRIAKKTGVSVDWLLTGKDTAQPEPSAKGKKAVKPASDKELLDTGLSYLDNLKGLPPQSRQALKALIKDMVANKERYKSVMEYWAGLRIKARPPRGRRRKK